VNLSGRRANRLRTGKGLDSHNAVTRFFGLDSRDFFDARRDDTESSQYGGGLKLAWEAGANTRLVASYTRGQQDGGQRYDQLIGGDGNLVADLRNFMLDFGYLRLERQHAGPFDSAFLSGSYNAQREERVNQGGNGNPRATINHEYEKTRVLGVQAGVVKGWARHTLSLGGDFYAERINAPSFGFNPVSGLATVRRGRVPDEASYDSGGIYAQDTYRPSERLTLQGNLRLGFVSYESRADASPLVAGRRLWPDDSFDTTSLTYRAGAVFALRPDLALTASVARGYRAPHVTDLGTLGLTGDGFEVAAVELAGRGATIGSSADARAVSTGVAVAQPTPESSRTFEAGLRWHAPRVEFDLVGFLTDIDDNITKQALILPQGALGSTLGDQTIVRQDANGVVYVPLASNPVLVQANYDEARLWGFEQRLRLRVNANWSASTVLTYLHAEDRRSGLPPNIEGGTPAPDGWFTLRFAPGGGRRGWIEAYAHAALEQDNLSSLDLGDRRTGAGRTRTSIASFFNNGARARGLIGPGADGREGTADDVLRATGETLAQIQTRVLGNASSSSLFTSVPGYAVFGVRGLWRLSSRHEVFVDVENLGDRNYRGISWGLDAPGRSVFVQYRARF
jgi:hemoglobin/transferrin/lactoferrin receptor protein